MSSYTLGIEINPGEIKIIQINKRMNGIEILKSFRQQISANEDFPSRLKQILAEQRLKGDLVVISLDSRKAIFRNLSLPFNNINQIYKIMKYEMEPYLPYKVEDVVLSSQIHDHNKTDNSDVFVGAVQKESIDSLCRSLNEAGLDPQLIMLDGIALYNLYVYTQGGSTPPDVNPDQVIALIEIQEERSILVIVQGQDLLFCRSISNPIRLDLDKFNSNDDNGLLRKAVDSLLEQINFTLYAFSSQQGNISITRIFITGRISAWPDVCTYFSRKLDLETLVFDPTKLIGKSEGGKNALPDGAFLWAIPLGLALEVKKNKKNRFNLRQDELAYQKKYSQYKGMAGVLILLVGIALALFMVNTYYRTNIQQERVNHINAAISRVYKDVYPKATDNSDLDEPLQMEKGLKTEQEKYKTYRVFAHSSLTPLQILKDLSAQVSDDLQIELIDLSIDRNQIKVKGIADSFESVDKLKNRLQKSNKYAQTVVESAKVKGSDNKVDFRLSITASEG